MVNLFEKYISEIEECIETISDYHELRRIYYVYYETLDEYLNINGSFTDFNTIEDLQDELKNIKMKTEIYVAKLKNIKPIESQKVPTNDSKPEITVNVANNNLNSNINKVYFDYITIQNELNSLNIKEDDKNQILSQIKELEKTLTNNDKNKKSKVNEILKFILSKGIDVGASVITAYLMNI